MQPKAPLCEYLTLYFYLVMTSYLIFFSNFTGNLQNGTHGEYRKHGVGNS